MVLEEQIGVQTKNKFEIQQMGPLLHINEHTYHGVSTKQTYVEESRLYNNSDC
jgi:hypothetical protein